MIWIVPCEKCGIREGTERHHLFSQTKKNRELYGDLIDHWSNIQLLCYDCHHNKTLDKYSEERFCEVLGIEPRSKAYQLRKRREESFGK